MSIIFSDITEDVREHVRVIGGVVQNARGRIGDLLGNQTWPPSSRNSTDPDDQPLITA